MPFRGLSNYTDIYWRASKAKGLADLQCFVSSVHSHTEEAVLEASEWDLDICSGKIGHVDQMGQGLLFIFHLGFYWTR